jgi:hypothetical protein
MTAKKLAEAAEAVDWNQNVKAFLKNTSDVEAIATANMRIAIWCRQFELADKGNAALGFVREIQTKAQQLTALIALGLYQSAASAMRGILEGGLYYSYFRTHPEELATLVRDSKYFVGKREILAYHKLHTVNFGTLEQAFGLNGQLESWYSKVSAIVHHQVPGIWAGHTALKDVQYNSAISKEVVGVYVAGEDVLHKLFFCTVGSSLWDGFSVTAKAYLLKNMSGNHKTLLNLDSA